MFTLNLYLVASFSLQVCSPCNDRIFSSLKLLLKFSACE